MVDLAQRETSRLPLAEDATPAAKNTTQRRRFAMAKRPTLTTTAGNPIGDDS